jgi:hypothetical protein
MRRILKGSALLAAVALVAVTGAGAAVSPSYQVAGIEFGATQSNVSSYTGLGLGSAGDRGFWQAAVAHDPLANCATVGSSCAITGGSFTLRSNTGSQLGASFTGGSFQLQSAAPGCGQQVYALTGNLSSLAGGLTLTGVLTYFRLQLRGRCVVLASSVQGSLAPAPAADSGGGQL